MKPIDVRMKEAIDGSSQDVSLTDKQREQINNIVAKTGKPQKALYKCFKSWMNPESVTGMIARLRVDFLIPSQDRDKHKNRCARILGDIEAISSALSKIQNKFGPMQMLRFLMSQCLQVILFDPKTCSRHYHMSSTQQMKKIVRASNCTCGSM